MKNLSTSVLSLCFILSALCSFSQNQKIPLNEPDYNKPKLFQNLPDSIVIDVSTLDNICNAQKGQNISIGFSDRSSFFASQFRTDVISKSSGVFNNRNPKTVILNLPDYAGANFTVSKIVKPDGTTAYTGRIINFKSGDLFELENKNGQYILVKKNYYELVNE